MKKLLPLILVGAALFAVVVVAGVVVVGYALYHNSRKPDLLFSESPSLMTNSNALVMSNREASPIRIDKVVYNGEFDAVASADGGIFISSKQPPFTMTIGESKEFVWRVPGGPASNAAYPKDILFVNVHTDRGVYRYDLR